MHLHFSRLGFLLALALAALLPASLRAQETWVARTSPTTESLWSVAYANGLWVACGEQGTIVTSPDGRAWTPRFSGFPAHWLVGVGYGAGVWVVVGESGLILTSPDGIIWTPRNAAGTRINAVAYGNGTFLAIDDAGGRWVSSNGINWSFGATGRSGALRGLVYGANTFVVTGISGIQTTPDGLVYTPRVTNNTTFLESAAYGRGLYISGGAGGITYTSSDSVTWSLLTSTTSVQLRGATFFNNQFVAVGTDGAIVTSTVGAVWTPRVSGTSELLLAAGAGPTSVIAVGFGGVILESSPTQSSPAIANQPVATTAAVGGSAAFAVVASGSAPLTYQWLKNGAAIAGATSDALSLTALIAASAGSYSVVVSNSSGSVTSNTATLTVTTAASAPVITAQPSDQSVGIGTTVTYSVTVSGTAPFNYQWRFNGAAIVGATSGTLILPNVTVVNAGSYTVLVTNAGGSSTSAAATLTVVQPPVITTPPVDQSVAVGSNVVFTVGASGAAPLLYQWSKDGRPIVAANNAIIALAAVTNNDAGSYAVSVTNTAGTVTSRTVTLVVSAASSRLSNLSVRTSAGAGSQTLIVGFVVAGQGAKPVLVRGIGPALSAFGVTGVSVDPQLALYRDSIVVAANDNWGDSPSFDQISQVSRTLGAFALGDPRSKDAALYVSLQPGGYSAQLLSPGGPGIALVELYDGDVIAPARLANVSARSQVGTGAGILIAGFNIQGNAPKTVLLRAIGPTLSVFGVSSALVDPQLVLYKGSDVLASNDDWWRNGGDLSLPPVFSSVGAFLLGNQTRDAALVTTLQPGSYTVQISGAGNTTGVALVEVYEVP